MSFFGFDTTLPRDRSHQSKAPGFGPVPDAFAGLSSRSTGNENDDADDDDDDAIDFEDTYDGLGDQLDEVDDALNDETFSSEPATQQNVGRDFDFSGQTARIANTLQEEQILFNARQLPQKSSPTTKPAKPARTGYENYALPGYIPQLEANASIWGIPIKKSASEPHQQATQPNQGGVGLPTKKMMSLEEVEAAMRAQTKRISHTAHVSQHPSTVPFSQPTQPTQPPLQHTPETLHQISMDDNIGTKCIVDATKAQSGLNMQQILEVFSDAPAQSSTPHYPGYPTAPQTLQRPHQSPGSRSHQPTQAQLAGQGAVPQILQRQRPSKESSGQRRIQTHPTPRVSVSQPRQILQNPNRLSGHGQPLSQPHQRPVEMPRAPPVGSLHVRGASYQGPVITHPEQLLRLSEEERAAFLIEDAKRAKRNHKIHLLSKDNGLMTPQDKNFITRIQLQQLVTATGNVNDQGPEAALAEDFYYQVYTQIRGAPRQTPHQPINQFAQTYLFQTGGRFGIAGRRHPRGGDNHMQRMQQQVQRAVEAAKAKPKNKQLVIEGSLGKISFSNAKTPKPLLNLKRAESGDVRPYGGGRRPSRGHHLVADRKLVLRDIENVYTTLMQLEDHGRHLPASVNAESDPIAIQHHMEWRDQAQALNQKLWSELKVMEPIISNSPTPHPFIAMLLHAKGKKAIPRIFRHIDEQQRVTVLTMIVVHLDVLDVIAHAQPHPDETTLPRSVREDVELFAHTVMPSLFAYIHEAPLNIVAGLLGLVLDRTNILNLVKTKIGLSILTTFVSRAELVKQSLAPEKAEWEQWTLIYNRLFDATEPALARIFPVAVNAPGSSEDVYVWQFLAAMGVGASPEQQQRLVIGVKDRVMEAVTHSKTLPPDMATVRLGNVNLFMRAIGLDVELLG